MRRILPNHGSQLCVLCALCGVLTAAAHQTAQAQQHYARWQFRDVGEHHLPPTFQIDFTQADWSGLVAGWTTDGALGADQAWPTLFDVHSGETVRLAPEEDGALVLDVHGSRVLTRETLYDHATGTFTPFDLGTVDAMNETGRLVRAEMREVIGGGQRVLLIDRPDLPDEPPMELIPPFEEEIAPGVFVPAPDELRAQDFAGDWIGGLVLAGPNDPEGFIANVRTGELTLLEEQVQFVNAAGDHFPFGTPRTKVPVPRADLPSQWHHITGPGAVNIHGQVVNALQVADDGRILAFAPGPVVEVLVDGQDLFDFQTTKLVEGIPLLIEGDYTARGVVSQGALDLVLLNWGRDIEADGRPDGWVHDFPAGRIDQAELDRVLLNWGSREGVPAIGVDPLASAAGVPEPASAISLLIVIVGLAACQRLRRHVCCGVRR